jgi:hypothetical protein
MKEHLSKTIVLLIFLSLGVLVIILSAEKVQENQLHWLGTAKAEAEMDAAINNRVIQLDQEGVDPSPEQYEMVKMQVLTHYALWPHVEYLATLMIGFLFLLGGALRILNWLDRKRLKAEEAEDVTKKAEVD